ncbi:MAG: conjugal transfer protein TraR [Ignavibacterium sp.]|jgi:RNA polymerase-binding transcription factor DksA|uniref:TraR/DksA family transcriptional regulator n=1 Tax=Ignavibacterium sp. TaxID=2651167 RepID=UPI0032974A08
MAKKQTKKPIKKATIKKGKEEKKKVKKAPAKKTVKKVVKKAAPAKKAVKKKEVKKVVAKKTSVKKETVKKPVKTENKVEKKKLTPKEEKALKQQPAVQSQVEAAVEDESKIDEIYQAELEAARRKAEALKKIKGYSKKDLEHFKKIILEKRDEILEQLQNLKEQMLDPSTGEYINENSPYSLHMAEQGTDAMEREKTFLYAQRETKFLGYLEDALKRIENGTYGICIECIEEPQHLCETCPLIPKARLEAVPHSQLCLPMKQRQEKK